MMVFFYIVLVANILYVFAGGIFHGTVWRNLDQKHDRYITLYGIVWTYDEWVVPIRMAFILLLFPFTFFFEICFYICCWFAVVLQYYGRTDYRSYAKKRLKDGNYIITRSIFAKIIKLKITLGSKRSNKRHGKTQALVALYFNIDSYDRQWLAKLFYLPMEIDNNNSEE